MQPSTFLPSVRPTPPSTTLAPAPTAVAAPRSGTPAHPLNIANCPAPGLGALLCIARKVRDEGPDPLGLSFRDLTRMRLTHRSVAGVLKHDVMALQACARRNEIHDLMQLLRLRTEDAATAAMDRLLGPDWQSARVDLVCGRLRAYNTPDANQDASGSSSAENLAMTFRVSIGAGARASDTCNAMAGLPVHQRVALIEALAHRMTCWVDSHTTERAHLPGDHGRSDAMNALCDVLTNLIAGIPEADRSTLLNAMWLLGTEPLAGVFGVVDGALDGPSRHLLAVQLARWCLQFPERTPELLDLLPPLDHEQRACFVTALRNGMYVRTGVPVNEVSQLSAFDVTPEEFSRSLAEHIPPRSLLESTLTPVADWWTSARLQSHGSDLSDARVRAAALTLLNDPGMANADTRNAFFLRHPLSPDERRRMVPHLLIAEFERSNHPTEQYLRDMYGITRMELRLALRVHGVRQAASRNRIPIHQPSLPTPLGRLISTHNALAPPLIPIPDDMDEWV